MEQSVFSYIIPRTVACSTKRTESRFLVPKQSVITTEMSLLPQIYSKKMKWVINRIANRLKFEANTDIFHHFEGSFDLFYPVFSCKKLKTLWTNSTQLLITSIFRHAVRLQVVFFNDIDMFAWWKKNETIGMVVSVIDAGRADSFLLKVFSRMSQ